MKRSEINGVIAETESFMARLGFHLPPWGYWGPEDWKGRGEDCREIVENMLGWDITDFGLGCFRERGLTLFTIRNGNPARSDMKPYAEKIMVAGENQETPMHFHWKKMEDIINRGGGNLVIELYGSTPDEAFTGEPIEVSIDGICRTVPPGGRVILTPGESICLRQRLYHRFYGEPGHGPVLIGEVSAVNDDNEDNRFHEPMGRFPEIEEDEPPLRLLVKDYPSYL